MNAPDQPDDPGPFTSDVQGAENRAENMPADIPPRGDHPRPSRQDGYADHIDAARSLLAQARGHLDGDEYSTPAALAAVKAQMAFAHANLAQATAIRRRALTAADDDTLQAALSDTLGRHDTRDARRIQELEVAAAVAVDALATMRTMDPDSHEWGAARTRLYHAVDDMRGLTSWRTYQPDTRALASAHVVAGAPRDYKADAAEAFRAIDQLVQQFVAAARAALDPGHALAPRMLRDAIDHAADLGFPPKGGG